MNRLKAKIDEQYERVNQIRDIIEGKKSSKDGISSQGQGHRDKLTKLRNEFNTVLVSAGAPIATSCLRSRNDTF